MTSLGSMWAELADLGRNGGTGGYRRFAWTRTDAALREWFTAEARRRSLDVVGDRAGNLWAWMGDPDADGPGLLLGFVDSRAFDALPAEERRRDALRCFAALFGDEALTPLDYADHRWGAEEFAPGGPTAAAIVGRL